MPSASRRGLERLLLAASERVYRALLVMYPKGFRRAFGEEMTRTFRDLCREALGQGEAGGLLGLWLCALLDLSTNAFAERSRAIVSSSSLVRWGGIAAVAGGLLLVAHGIGHSNRPRIGETRVLALVYSFGMLLVLGGLFGLAHLVRRRGMLGLSGSGGPSWARRWGAVGLVLASLAAASAMALAVWALATGGFVWPGGFVVTGEYSSVAKTFWLVLSLLVIFGLPLATVLLGIAAWRSEVLGRWRALPLVVGVLASPLVPLTIIEVVNLALYPHPWQFIPWARFLVSGGPGLVVGVGWVLLGILLFAGREGDEERRPVHAG